MPDSKEVGWEHDYDATAKVDSSVGESVVQRGDTAETDGWQQYRRWISKAPAPRDRRVDAAVYTWKGYRSWAEQVKRNWSDN